MQKISKYKLHRSICIELQNYTDTNSSRIVEDGVFNASPTHRLSSYHCGQCGITVHPDKVSNKALEAAMEVSTYMQASRSFSLELITRFIEPCYVNIPIGGGFSKFIKLWFCSMQ